MERNCLIWYITCASVIHVCQVVASDKGRVDVKLNQLERKHNALQNDVDQLWARFITSGIHTQEYGNKTRTEDIGDKTQDFISNANGTLATIQSMKTDVENLITSSRNGLKHEKRWQRETIRSMTKLWEYFRNNVTKENDDLKQKIHDMEEKHELAMRDMEEQHQHAMRDIKDSKQNLSNIETENRDLRNIIVQLQTHYQNKQSSFETENHESKESISELQNNIKMKQELNKCDDGWEKFNGHCYLYMSEQRSWDDSLAFCESMNSHLVEITADVELGFITEFVRKSRSSYDFGHWTGATDRDQVQGAFVYQNSKGRVPDKFWREGQPSDRLCAGLWDYYYKTRSGVLEFFDTTCNYLRRAVCEKP